MVRTLTMLDASAISEIEVRRGKQQRDKQDDDADRARRADVEEFEGFEITAYDDVFGTPGGTAFGEQKNDREGASEGPDRAQERQQDADVAQAGTRDDLEALQ